MMNLYLVRHGESQGNLDQIHQTPNSPLSKLGLQQAQQVAKRFTRINIDIILSSPFKRATQTAQAISKVTEIRFELIDNLREIKRPTIIEGKYVHDPNVIKIKNKIRDNWHNPDWYHSDEDNFFDTKHRAVSLLNELSQRSENNICAVTHGTFLRMIVILVILGKDFQPNQYRRTLTTLSTINTGITMLSFTQNHWQLETYNDHAHLG